MVVDADPNILRVESSTTSRWMSVAGHPGSWRASAICDLQADVLQSGDSFEGHSITHVTVAMATLRQCHVTMLIIIMAPSLCRHDNVTVAVLYVTVLLDL